MRSPGSTLKPFIYGLAFEAGLAHPETLIEDRPTRFGTYTPENFDEDFHGTVTIRQALGNSLNIPAVKVLLRRRARHASSAASAAPASWPQLPGEAQPSLAIALGGLGMTLKDISALYAALARRRRAGASLLAPRANRPPTLRSFLPR